MPLPWFIVTVKKVREMAAMIATVRKINRGIGWGRYATNAVVLAGTLFCRVQCKTDHLLWRRVVMTRGRIASPLGLPGHIRSMRSWPCFLLHAGRILGDQKHRSDNY